MITLTHYLVLGVILFCIGVFGTLAKRNIVAVLMGIELMLNSVNINLIAFNRFIAPEFLTGHLFALFIIVVAAAEVAVGLALVILIYRDRKTINVEDLNWLKW